MSVQVWNQTLSLSTNSRHNLRMGSNNTANLKLIKLISKLIKLMKLIWG